MPAQQFIHEVDGPEDPMKDQKENRVVIVPTDHHGIDAQEKIEQTGASHVKVFRL